MNEDAIDPNESMELETTPEAGGIIGNSKESAESIFWLADNIERLTEAHNKIHLAMLKLAQPGDWMLFEGGKDKSAKAEIGFAGSLRIASRVGVSFINWTAHKETGRDERGEWYRWEFECDAIFRNRTVRVYGRFGTRDKFFGRAYGADKAIYDINEGDVKIAARRACMKEGVKVHFGLHHMDPSYLKKNGIALESAGGHSFKGRDEEASETEVVTVEIDVITVKKGTTKAGKPYSKFTVKDVEGVGYSTFSETFAEKAKESKESGNLAEIHFVKTQYGPEIKAIEIVAKG